MNHDLCFSGGTEVVFSIFQSFFDASASGWCFFTLEDSVYGLMLRKLSSTVYRWQGVFIPLEVSIINFAVCKINCSFKFWMPHKLLLLLLFPRI